MKTNAKPRKRIIPKQIVPWIPERLPDRIAREAKADSRLT